MLRNIQVDLGVIVAIERGGGHRGEEEEEIKHMEQRGEQQEREGVKRQQTKIGKGPSHYPREPSTRDMIYQIFGKVWDMRTSMERMEGRMTAIRGQILSLEEELAS